MAVSDISAGAIGLLGNGLVWGAVALIVLVVAFLIFYVMKKRRLKFPVYEISNIGNGKISLFKTKAGWFGRTKYLFKLIDWGKDKQMETKEGKIIMGADTRDFHDIEGYRGYFCYRKSDDPRVLVAVDKFDIDELSNSILGSIAPARIRSEAVDIVKETAQETRSSWEAWAPYVALGAIVIFLIVGMIFASQTFQHAIDTASQMINEAQQLHQSAINSANVVQGVAP